MELSLDFRNDVPEGLRVSKPCLGGQIGLWGVAAGVLGSDWVAGLCLGRCKGSDWGPRVRSGLVEGQIGAGARETRGGSDQGKLQTQSESSCSCNMNTN